VPKTLADLLRERFGVETYPRVNPVTDTVGTSVQMVAGANPNRLGLVMVNLSANEIFVLPERTVSPSRGIRLGPAGGFFSLVWDEDFHLVAWDWYGIATGPGSPIMVLEVNAK